MNTILITVQSSAYTLTNIVIECSILGTCKYDGYIRLEIDGVEYTSLSNGTAVFVIPNLTYGNKLAIATCKLNNEIVAYGCANFVVNKLTPTIVVTSDGNIAAGHNQTLTVMCNSGCTGLCYCSFSEEDSERGYAGEITESTSVAKIDMPNLPAGEYSSEVWYGGDDNYNESEHETITFTVT